MCWELHQFVVTVVVYCMIGLYAVATVFCSSGCVHVIPSHLVGVILCSYSRSIDMQRGYCYNDYISRVLLFSSSLRIAVVALRGAVLHFFYRGCSPG